MPRILVTTDGSDGREKAVVLQERVASSDLESDHFSAQLVERVGWALVDADEIEHRTPAPGARPARRTVKRDSTETRPLRAA
jgi:hypothetical protein